VYKYHASWRDKNGGWHTQTVYADSKKEVLEHLEKYYLEVGYTDFSVEMDERE
jgi:hypothetical protein